MKDGRICVALCAARHPMPVEVVGSIFPSMDDITQLIRDLASPESRAEIERNLADSGETLEQSINDLKESFDYKIPWVILHEADAGKLLDVLPRC